jgi:DNA-directed RNA polymerase subunit RPC12/RpoP
MSNQEMGRINLKGYKCERCGHTWFPRKYNEATEGPPILCPKCKSAYWDKPKLKGGRKK